MSQNNNNPRKYTITITVKEKDLKDLDTDPRIDPNKVSDEQWETLCDFLEEFIHEESYPQKLREACREAGIIEY